MIALLDSIAVQNQVEHGIVRLDYVINCEAVLKAYDTAELSASYG